MSDHETDEPEEATCPYCRSTSWCKHQLMHLDETFGEVEDYGVYEEAQELLVKCVVALLKSGKELPESLGDKTLGKFIPLDPDDRPEPTEEAVRDWLADESYYFSRFSWAPSSSTPCSRTTCRGRPIGSNRTNGPRHRPAALGSTP